MAEIERMTITLPSDMAAVVKGAVEGGDYASSSEVLREALRDWKIKRMLQLQELAALKADIDRGLADVAEGRMQDFDAARIIERGEKAIISRPLALRLTDAAEADLAEIWTTLASEASEPTATRFIAAIESAFEPLRQFPLSGPAREQLAPGLRVTFVSPYAIYYVPLADAVVIVRVIHGARDIAALAQRGGFA